MSFDDFVNRVGAEEAARKKFESEKPQRLAKWRKDCDSLYAEIEGILAPTLRGGVLKAMYSNTYKDDPDFGTHECRVMTFELGDRRVTLTPKFYIGAGYNGILEFNRPSRKPDMGIVRPEDNGVVSDWKILHETPKQGRNGILMGQTDHNLSDLNTENIGRTLQYLLS